MRIVTALAVMVLACFPLMSSPASAAPMHRAHQHQNEQLQHHNHRHHHHHRHIRRTILGLGNRMAGNPAGASGARRSHSGSRRVSRLGRKNEFK